VRIAIVAEWFTEEMGYLENLLPPAMSSLGHEVHVVSSVAQVYFNDPNYQETYEPFAGPRFAPEGRKELGPFTLHRLPLIAVRGRFGMRRFFRTLRAIKPDVIQALDPISIAAAQSAMYSVLASAPLFTGNHMVASAFPPARQDRRSLLTSLKLALSLRVPGSAIAAATRKCYAVTPDAATIATRFYGVPARKVVVTSLGVDTAVFSPDRDSDARAEARRQLDVAESDLLCIYTGRFSDAKDPSTLASAIELLRGRGERVRALFVGSGPQSQRLNATDGCSVRPFVPYRELARLFAAADVGVWPRQESTSMLDAAGSGLPIVISDRVKAVERVEGNGLTYSEGDPSSLAERLMQLQDPTLRERLGAAGAQKVRERYSWIALAQQRIEDYDEALSLKRGHRRARR
jgi:glycosyltransferase involved in cell wall biosynthesis